MAGETEHFEFFQFNNRSALINYRHNFCNPTFDGKLKCEQYDGPMERQLFELTYDDKNKAMFMCFNGKYMGMGENLYLTCEKEEAGETEKFSIDLI